MGMKLLCLDGPGRHWTTGHVHGAGGTMTRPPWYFVTGATIATTETVPFSPAACVCIMGHGFVSLVGAQQPCREWPM